MPKMIGSPEQFELPGSLQKICEEYVGLLNTGDAGLSIARTHSPGGWQGPAQYSDFHEYILVLSGTLVVEHAGGMEEIEAGQAIHVQPGEEVIYSTPSETGADYVTVCAPAYTRASIHKTIPKES